MKPSIPKGTRDFTPQETLRREYIFSSIRDVFKLYGFVPIETPAMENLATLTGKYGDEGDRLIFKILNSGDYLSKAPDKELDARDSKKLTKHISEKALRYDLTVPFARFVVQNRNEINFPFKRYQIQPVWRADRPQKGRYREFFQCDADVIGTNTLYNEFELVQIFDRVFEKLKIKAQIKVNNRKILAGLAEVIGAADKMIDLTIAMDKLEKIGMEKVQEELLGRGFANDALKTLAPVLEFEGSAADKLEFLNSMLENSSIGRKGVEEMQTLINYVESYDLKSSSVMLDLSLARGLDYYTGTIFEVIAEGSSIGSICGGGRYDDLTDIFGLKDVSGVGISFGADRIYDVMLEQNLFPTEIATSSKILLVNFGSEEESECIKIVNELRDNQISAEYYPDATKMKKQMSYADAKNIPFVLMVGSDEIKNSKYSLKNMETGEQSKVSLTELIQMLADASTRD
ncbi:MAG: histidine--tRNA ligase [Bacteroidia bacterium]|nr:histidine--tRNA ligase [Bacteroidia bacterium]